jgi:hypothetical protein
MSVIRYAIGKLSLPFFTQWVLDKFELDWNYRRVAQPIPKEDHFPSPIVDAGNVQFHNYDLVRNTLF